MPPLLLPTPLPVCPPLPTPGPRKWTLTPSARRRERLSWGLSWRQSGGRWPGWGAFGVGPVWPGWAGPRVCHGSKPPAPDASAAMALRGSGCRPGRQAESGPVRARHLCPLGQGLPNGGCTAQQPLDLTWNNLAPGGGVCRDTATSGADGLPSTEAGLTVWPSAVWQAWGTLYTVPPADPPPGKGGRVGVQSSLLLDWGRGGRARKETPAEDRLWADIELGSQYLTKTISQHFRNVPSLLLAL